MAYRVPICVAVRRTGDLRVGDAAIIAVARAAHRAEAFAAVEGLVDAVKRRAPIWKEELYSDGTAAYVEGCSIALDEVPADQQ